MNNALQKQSFIIDGLVETQRSYLPVVDDEYCIGVLNGMILCQSVVNGDSPNFYSFNNRPKKNKIRHKAHR